MQNTTPIVDPAPKLLQRVSRQLRAGLLAWLLVSLFPKAHDPD